MKPEPPLFNDIDAKARYDWKLMKARCFLRGNLQLAGGGTETWIILGDRDFGELSCEWPDTTPEQLLHDPDVPIRLRVVIRDETIFRETYRIADLRRIARKLSSERKPFLPWNRTWHHTLWPEILRVLPEEA